jgi:hypothetical protein
MGAKPQKRYSMEFGKKEKVLNYTCQNYQLTRPSKVGGVMALIRECQPHTIEEWEEYYFENAYTDTKDRTKITKEILDELGERLYEKIIGVVIPEWREAFSAITLQDCVDYIHNLTIERTYDGFLREKSAVNDGLAKIFKDVVFEESDSELDHAGDIDYIARIGDKAIGFQIKPVTANANFGNYSATERMKASFADFEEKYGGKVFIVFSEKEKIVNTDVIGAIRREIDRLRRS